MRFTLYPIRWLADADEDRFDRTLLPFDVVDDIRIEDVRTSFYASAFDHFTGDLGTKIVEKLQNVQYALVHRYTARAVMEGNEFIGEETHDSRSKQLIHNLAACLRLIRPMRQDALLMQGTIRNDGSFDLPSFDVPPLHLLEVPDVQRLFKLRNQDANDLKRYAQEFLRGMAGEFWKFRMAVQFYDMGHFQPLNWKARYMLWCSAMESIYTSNHPDHQGKRVATARIRWFIGEDTSIYAPGDIVPFVEDPNLSVGQVVSDIYDLRNLMAHGDRIPEPFFNDTLRQGLNGAVAKWEVLTEAVSFIIRTSLLKILHDGLLNHFTGADSAQTYFRGQGLTNSRLPVA